MEDRDKVKKVMVQMELESKNELKINPEAELGKCVISSSGYSECKDNMTEEACKKQNSWGVKAKWYVGEKC